LHVLFLCEKGGIPMKGKFTITKIALIIHIFILFLCNYLCAEENIRSFEIKNICLIYHGSDQRRNWQPEDFKPYLIYTDISIEKSFPLFDTFLLIEYRSSDGKYFWGGQKKEEIATIEQWKWLINRWASCLDAINECVGEIKKEGKIQNKINIIITIPEPDINCINFGTLSGSEVPLNFQKTEDVLKALQWYMDEVLYQIKVGGYEHLNFVGFYYLAESIPAGRENVIKAMAEIIHRYKLKFFWIPYFTGNNVWLWKDLNFDYMFLQPNYFFEGKGGNHRLSLAGYRIQEFQCGVEMELDDRIFKSETHQYRFQQYLQAGTHFQWVKKPIAWYQANDTIYKLAHSQDDKLKSIYRDIAYFIHGEYQPPSYLPPIEEYKVPDRKGNNYAHIDNGTKVIKPNDGFCLSLNPEWMIDGDITNYSGTAGFGCCGIPGEIVLDFSKNILVHRVQLLLFNLDERYYQYHIDLSNDGQNWNTVVDKTQGEYRDWQTDIIPSQTAHYLRIVPTYNSAHQSLFQVVEIEVY